MALKIICVSNYQENYSPLANLTLHENRIEFAHRWGHQTMWEKFADRAPDEPWASIMRRISFCKFDSILAAMSMSKAPWLWYGDCDAMVMNMGFDLEAYAESLGDGYVFNTVDSNGPNGGSILIANVPLARAFITAARELRKDLSVPFDNEAMTIVKDRFPGVYKLIPQRPLNAYDYGLYPKQPATDALGNPGCYHEGDFFLHWPGRTLDQRIAHYNEWKGKVIQ